MQRDSVARAGECLPGWHAASRLTCPAPKVTDPLSTALLSWAGTQTSPITSLGTLNTSLHPRSLCPCSAAARSRLQVPLKTDGMQIIPPFQLLFKPCWPPLRAAAASHTHTGREGTGVIWGARRAQSIHHSTQRNSSSTEEGSPVCSRSAAEGCELSGRRSFHCKKLSCPREGDMGTAAQARDAPR